MSEPEIEQPATGEAVAEQETSDQQLGLLDTPEASDTAYAHLRAVLEAAIYVADEPLPAAQIAQALGRPKDVVEKVLGELVAEYNQAQHGLTIREVAGGYQMSTKAEFHDEIRAFVKKLKPPLKLSLAALETLAVIAYKQPITAPEIMEIRGVQGAGVVKTLLERKLVTAAGRKQVVGRPVLYKTTKDFLVQFGLKDLAELPTLKEFEEWSRLALGDSDSEDPPIPRPEPPAGDPAEPPPEPVGDPVEPPGEPPIDEPNKTPAEE